MPTFTGDVGWWPHTTSPQVASARLRCLRIHETLRRRGWPSRLFQPGDALPRILVLSKRYDPAALEFVRALRRRSASDRPLLVLDLCDNHFSYRADGGVTLERRAVRLREMIGLVDHVVVGATPLGDVLAAEVPTAAWSVIPDLAEPPAMPTRSERVLHPIDEWRLHRLRRRLEARAAIAHSHRLVWFGHHGSPGVDGGLRDLYRVRTALLARTTRADAAPVSLTVISDSATTFDEIARDWPTPIDYLPWARTTVSRALRLHSCALIPITPNDFTRSKTANRPLTALAHGLNVVADAIPSYLPLAGACVLDDWPDAFGGYLEDPARRATHLAVGREIAARDFSTERITDMWITLFERL